ncbi:LemA family protein [Mycoplasmopsis alligatoris]|uniref:LemA family protein n=1 Tax=Mycoplasmopsis alligatoris A21JP2 TaxID=747682 RepID=D4XX14_9BACT|nr:LemA family protein [Mycoplasmopsis alligatoris]EFF41134.1 LemA family protein [Mycoplasmopsis alligatoris A21JP2]
MGNLFDNSKQTNPEGYNPNADNTSIKAKSTTAANIIWYISFILIVPIVIHIITFNKLRRLQTNINNASSTIDVQLTKRSSTLTKLFDATKGYMTHEKDVLAQVTQMRNLASNHSQSVEQQREMDNLNNSIFGRLLAVSENYPDLKASKLFEELMAESVYLEREISAARRLYNNYVTELNTSIVTWPASIVAQSMSLTTQPLFVATQQERQDVKLGFN